MSAISQQAHTPMHSVGAPRRAFRTAVVAVLVLACTGCQLGLDVEIALNRNGGGSLGVAVAADEALLERAEQADVDPLGEFVAAAADLRADGWSVSDTTDDAGTRTVRLSRPFDDAEAFNQLADQLTAALAADEVVLLEDLSLTVTDDVLTLIGRAGAQPTRAVRDYGLRPDQVVRLVQREDALAYRVAVNVPGEVVNTNGEQEGERRVIWDVAPGEITQIGVESTRPGPPLIRAVGGGVIGAVVAAAILWFLARRRQPEARSARIRSFSART